MKKLYFGNIIWTEAEEKLLIEELQNGLDLQEIIENHNRTDSAIRIRIKKLFQENIIDENILNNYLQKSIKKELPENAYKIWTKDEEMLLTKYLNDGLSLISISELHRRSIGSIESRIKKLFEDKIINDIIYNKYINWSENEKKLLIKNLQNNLNLEELSKLHSRSVSTIKNCIIDLIMNKEVKIIQER